MSNLSEEKLKTIKERLEFCKLHNLSECTLSPKTIQIVLNYIDKLQKENKELNKTIEQLENTIVELSTTMEE